MRNFIKPLQRIRGTEKFLRRIRKQNNKINNSYVNTCSVCDLVSKL